MHRPLIVLFVSICGPVAILQAADPPAAARPNIILVLADDVGLGDVHCSGGSFHTPHIDSLAAGGTRFEYCYSTPLCGPSRCELLTGRYPFRTGLIGNKSENAIQPGRELMIPTILKKAGYVTASVGKWGQMSFGPGRWGFDEYLVFPGSGRYWRRQTKHYTVNGHEQDLPAGHYLPDIMHEFLVDFIARHKNQPFFIYYPMSHIHVPIVRTPDSKPGATKEELYAANIEYMDKLVGKLIAELDRQHLRQKTLVLFTGDNGTADVGASQATVNGRHISGMKGMMLEGGSRVPLLVSWPGVTPPGKVSGDLIDFSDFFATVAELAGAKLPEGVVLDSHSFAPQIRGETGSPRNWVYVELCGKSYVRGHRFKLTNRGELFDMAQSPFQEIPVAPDSADPLAAAARKNLQAVLDRHPAAPWIPPRQRNAPAATPAGKQGDVTCRVHPETTFQTIVGFGAGFSGGPGCEAFDALKKPEDRTRAFDLLFGNEGVRLNIVRVTISPVAQPLADGHHYDWANDKATQAVWKCVQEVQKRTKPTLYAVPFTPPARWKDSGALTHGGSLKHEHYADYAEYLADFLAYYHGTLGVDIDVLSLQNEPGVAAPWESCVWSGAELRDFLKVLAPLVRQRGLKPRFMLSEGATWTGAWEHVNPTLQDPAARPLLDILASHSYGPANDKSRQKFAEASQQTGLPVWMSEMSLMQPPAPDDPGIGAALRTAQYIRRDMLEGRAAAWIYCFAMFTSHFPGSMGVLSPADGEGPRQGELLVPKRFWAMANYSHFVPRGWKRMRIDAAGLANTGFVSPDGDRFAIVALNAVAAARRAAYDFGDRSIGDIEAFATTADLNLARVPLLKTEAHRFDAMLLPASVTTFVGKVQH